jgi:hypothetical protein
MHQAIVQSGSRRSRNRERRQVEFYYQQVDALRTVRLQVMRESLAEGKKHQACKRLCEIPSIGPIEQPYCLAFCIPRTVSHQRQLWTYIGFGIETDSSADRRMSAGSCNEGSPISIRGLNRNCNHDLTNLFKGAAIVASHRNGSGACCKIASPADSAWPKLAIRTRRTAS